MSQEISPEIQKELLDDFYAECDELLTAMRERLAQLEAPASGASDRSAVEDFYRRMHSIKGISGIVGLRSAETLAHAAEDLLRRITRENRAGAAGEVDLLFQSVRGLDRIIAAHRLSQSPPEIGEILTRLRAIGAQALPAEPKGAAETPVPVAGRMWKAVFTPTADLQKRGISVQTVRERLGQIGVLHSATPVVGADKSFRFEFDVEMAALPGTLDSWAAEGVEFAASETPALPPPPPEGAPSEFSVLTPSHLVRVDLSRLDELMRIAGELVIHRSRLDDRLKELGEDTGAREISLALGRSLRELHGAISQVRMVPVAEVFARMPFAVRDLCRASGKRVRVELRGQQTEIDKFLVERLKEPLLHLVRNAVSHGIESPAERIAAGKPSEALLVLEAQSVGESILIRVRDDGRGIDPARVAAAARKLGLDVPANPDAAALLDILCLPGFSTRDEADLAAGRGVGMAVVQTAVHQLGGAMALETQPGVGTEFILRIPLSLSIADAIIVAVGEQLCAVPLAGVREIVQIPVSETRAIERTEVAVYRGGLLPILRLRRTFGFEPSPSPILTILVLEGERGLAGLVVDAVRSQREIVVRPLLDPLLRSPGMAGATELGDGRPILVLAPATLTAGLAGVAEDQAAAASA